ncbi:MAG: diaminopimelate epimerase [Phycisphaerales bacterium]|nr:diaminopimelate epimerase [Phycisphaerales bacterium]
MRFVKMHGIGNDYIYINGFAESVRDPAALARRVSDRHFSIGGDGIILVLPPELPPETPSGQGPTAHVRMRMFNADGSESEMCGNGIRCVCKFAHDHDVVPGIRQANPMKVQTGRGVLSLAYTLDEEGKVKEVTVDMGEPILQPGLIPVNLPGERVVNHPIAGVFAWPVSLGDWQEKVGMNVEAGMTCVSMGNPHVVFFVRDAAGVPLEMVGPIVEHHALFPRRINVHFVQILSQREIVMRTWERGSGITLACGTGACASLVAGVLTGHCSRQVLAHLPGGDLHLDWRASDQHVLMTGPAVEVFGGRIARLISDVGFRISNLNPDSQRGVVIHGFNFEIRNPIFEIATNVHG